MSNLCSPDKVRAGGGGKDMQREVAYADANANDVRALSLRTTLHFVVMMMMKMITATNWS